MAFTTRPELTGNFGMTSTTHWLASAAGQGMLERGGNAFDAATAAAFVLHLAEPHLNGPAGDVPILIHNAGADETAPRVICGQGPAPKGATIAAYREAGYTDIVPGSGLLATVIPGAFDAWMLMFRDHGSMTLGEVLAPAIHYAEQGLPLVQKCIDGIAALKPVFEAHWTGSAAVYMPNGDVPAAMQFVRNPALGECWRRVVREAEAASADRAEQAEAARQCWAEGFIAETIDRFCRETETVDGALHRHRAVLTGDDLANWRATYEAPVGAEYCGHTVFKPGPWSQGPVLLACLRLLAGTDVAERDPLGAGFVHLVTEVMKLSYADREKYYADPDFIDVPLDALLSEEYLASRRGLIGEIADNGWRPGSVPGADRPEPPFRVDVAVREDAGAGEPTMLREKRHAGDTCHIDVVDRFGNMVSATPSGGWLRSSPVIPELGFPLNSRAQMFWLDERLPNALAPGKRPRTTLTPSMAWRDGRPYMAFGTPGGESQDQWQLIFLLRHIHHGMNLQEAIEAPSFHSEHWTNSFAPRLARPGYLALEGRFESAVAEDLIRRGHDVRVGGPWSEGRLCAVSQDNGVFRAGANPRGMQGYAVGR